ncbi:MAG: hypothetical protein R3324_05715 [Halobacteriales archaeon]|nr:hypothetical protein [Halobacteriales archaeon]
MIHGLESVTASQSVTAFVGYVLVALASVTLTVYAVRNRRRGRLEGYDTFLRYLLLAGLAGVVFGVTGAVNVANQFWPILALRVGAHLSLIMFLAFALRDAATRSPNGPAGTDDAVPKRIRRIELVFVAVILVETAAVAVLGRIPIVQIIVGVGSLIFAVYGVWFGEQVESLMRGTTLDTLARHLIPVLIAAGFYGLADLADVLGVDPVLARSAANVFVILLAAFLASSVIRLQQNIRKRRAPT